MALKRLHFALCLGLLASSPTLPTLRRICKLNADTHALKHRQNLSEITVYLNPSVCVYVSVCVCVCVCVSVFAWSYKSFYFVSEHFIPNSSSWTFCLHFIPLQCHTQHSRAALSSAASLCSKKIPSIIMSASGKVNCKAHSSNSSSLLRPNVCLLELSAFGWKTKPLLRSI